MMNLSPNARWGLIGLILILAPAADARDAKQVRLFRAVNPCPATGKASGACPGWVVDHVKPLCGGGADHPSNMQWQKRADSLIKDKAERAECSAHKKKA